MHFSKNSTAPSHPLARTRFFSSGRTHDKSLDPSSLKRGAASALFFFALIFLALPAYAQVKSAAPVETVAPGDYRLIGTMEGKTTGAVLVDSTGLQTFYRLNDQLPDGSRLVKVGSYSVVVRQSDGTASELYINHDMKTAPQTGFAASPPASPPANAGPVPPVNTRERRLTNEQKNQVPPWLRNTPDAARNKPRQRRHDRSKNQDD